MNQVESFSVFGFYIERKLFLKKAQELFKFF
jgi:hypothetical protein